MNAFNKLAVPTPLFTLTDCTKAPLTYAGVVAVKVVEFTTLTFVAATLPIVTVVPGVKPVPVKVIDVPPPVVPEVGAILTKVGAGAM